MALRSADRSKFSEPLVVNVLRGQQIDSCHRVIAVIADPNGKVLEAWGDPGRTVFPRSSVKAMQALPLIETGAADHFSLSDEEIALACGSHGGAPEQVTRLERWLNRMGLSEAALECGVQWPMDSASANALRKKGETPRKIHNNCSGKHTGFLATAIYLNEPLNGYIGIKHPVQRRVMLALQELTGFEPPAEAFAIDGCGIPTIAVPIRALATAAARIAKPNGLSVKRQAALERIRRSIAAAPDMIAGQGRMDTVLTWMFGEDAIVKSGAEGVFLAAVPKLGLGIALKVEDGAKRAADVAAINLLKHVGIIDTGKAKELGKSISTLVNNSLDDTVGEIKPDKSWPSRRSTSR